jgi:hypothetical protein
MASAEPEAAEAELPAASGSGTQHEGQQHDSEGISTDGVANPALVGEGPAEPRSTEEVLSGQQQREDREQANGDHIEATATPLAESAEQQLVHGGEFGAAESQASDAQQEAYAQREASHVQEDIAEEEPGHVHGQRAISVHSTKPPAAQLPTDAEGAAVVNRAGEQRSTEDSAVGGETPVLQASSPQHSATEQRDDASPERHAPVTAEGETLQEGGAVLVTPAQNIAGPAEANVVGPSPMSALASSTLPVFREVLTSS